MLMAYVFAGGTYRLDYLPRNFIVDYQYLDR